MGTEASKAWRVRSKGSVLGKERNGKEGRGNHPLEISNVGAMRALVGPRAGVGDLPAARAAKVPSETNPGGRWGSRRRLRHHRDAFSTSRLEGRLVRGAAAVFAKAQRRRRGRRESYGEAARANAPLRRERRFSAADRSAHGIGREKARHARGAFEGGG